MFVRPHVAGLGVHGEALRVPVTPCPDLGQCVDAVYQRIVVRNTPVVVKPNRCSVVICEVLRRVGPEVAGRGPLTVPERHVHVASTVESNATAPHRTPFTSVAVRLSVEELFNVVQPVVLEPTTDHGEATQRVQAGLHVTHIQEAILFEVGVEPGIAQPRLLQAVHRHCASTQRENVGQAIDRVGQEYVIPDDAQTTGALCDEQIALGREFH